MKGFSLVELMVALLASFILMVGSYKVLTSTTRTSIQASASIDVQKSFSTARRALNDLFQRAGTDPNFTSEIIPVDIQDTTIAGTPSPWVLGTQDSPTSEVDLISTKVEVYQDQVPDDPMDPCPPAGPCTAGYTCDLRQPGEHFQVYVSNGPSDGAARNTLVIKDVNAQTNGIREIIPNVVQFSVRLLDSTGLSLLVPWRNNATINPLGGSIDRRRFPRSVEIELWIWSSGPQSHAYSGTDPMAFKYFAVNSDGVWVPDPSLPLLLPVFPPSFPTNVTTFAGQRGSLAHELWRAQLSNTRYEGTRPPCPF